MNPGKIRGDVNMGGVRGVKAPEGFRGMPTAEALGDVNTLEGFGGGCPVLGMLLSSSVPSCSPRSVCSRLTSRSQRRQGGQDRRRGWSRGLRLPCPSLGCPMAPVAPPELELGWAPVPTQGGGAAGGRDPMGFWRKASLCSTFPSFYGVVLFMAREGNEQPARRLRQTR